MKLAKKKRFSDSAGLHRGIEMKTVRTELKVDFVLGHGHAMAFVALLNAMKRIGD